jgi:hypothetical protein
MMQTFGHPQSYPKENYCGRRPAGCALGFYFKAKLAALPCPARTMRLSDELITHVDAWAAKQADEPSRSEAIRRLVEIGLKAKAKQ